jgi:hypothetical protein
MNINLNLSVGWWTLWVFIYLVGFWLDYLCLRRYLWRSVALSFVVAALWPIMIVLAIPMGAIMGAAAMAAFICARRRI